LAADHKFLIIFGNCGPQPPRAVSLCSDMMDASSSLGLKQLEPVFAQQ
jgi:hypothetical protein